ncbi:hypothetical protein V6N13_026261 [Hibiscus sabdariffa]
MLPLDAITLGDDTLNKPQEMSVSLAALKASYMIQVLQAIFRRNRETVAKMFSKHGVVFNFTCMDFSTSKDAGENALERYDAGGYAQVPATNRSDSGNTLWNL